MQDGHLQGVNGCMHGVVNRRVGIGVNRGVHIRKNTGDRFSIWPSAEAVAYTYGHLRERRDVTADVYTGVH